MTKKLTVVLNEKDIAKIIAEKYEVDQYDVDISMSCGDP